MIHPMMSARSARPWLSYALGVLCVAAIVAAVLVVGPASSEQSSEGRPVPVVRGVVQETVSGSGNVEAASQLDLGFKTSGVVSHVYVTQGAHVVAGELLAELNPDSSEVALEQARANLQAATATLLREEETDGEGSSDEESTGHKS
ncbi:MAG TPA: biotin/lipoyl-binding protein, partial [Acidimicrobiales bacterium]|nr:biotin/lipoyl-binding protein [Acidimicrobiales bacterium]